MEFRGVGGEGREVTHDGRSFGSMLVRGPWVAAAYFNAAAGSAHEQYPGWFDTGDVVTIDKDGFIQIVDRTKDVVKSGGEWISSIDLENIAQAHPAIKEAAIVARPDTRWGERSGEHTSELQSLMRISYAVLCLKKKKKKQKKQR